MQKYIPNEFQLTKYNPNLTYACAHETPHDTDYNPPSQLTSIRLLDKCK